MKFFFFIFFISNIVYAQSANTSNNMTKSDLPFWSFSKIREKSRINYFSETAGSSIKKWDDNEVSSEGEKQRDPVRTFHSFNLRYSLFDNLSFLVSPRFVTVIGDRNDIRPNDDHNVIQIDDWQFGFHNVFYKTKNFRYGQRLTHRQPFSRYSKNSNINSQIEWTHDITWQPAPGWRLIHWNNYRYYAYNDKSSDERYRINFSTILNYDFNDKWRTQLMYELDMQHRNPKDGPAARSWNYFKKYENNLSYGIGYNPINNLSIIPFIRTLELSNIRNDNTIVGVWILGKVL